MNKPFLTVFTPAYNRAYTLPRTYGSLRSQRNTDFIWLIVDDGSTANTAELVRQWQAEENGFEIRYIYKENGGMHTAHNTAYAAIDTELNVCIDSDDALAPALIQQDHLPNDLPPSHNFHLNINLQWISEVFSTIRSCLPCAWRWRQASPSSIFLDMMGP